MGGDSSTWLDGVEFARMKAGMPVFQLGLIVQRDRSSSQNSHKETEFFVNYLAMVQLNIARVATVESA